MKKFSTLFKKSSLGKIEQWTIEVSPNGEFADIVTHYGELDGRIQKTSDTIKEGKNAGKANATTAHEQALKEAQSKYEKKLKSGYVDSLEKAQSGEVDKIIEGGVSPMLAHSFAKSGDKIIYPCAGQPKLDGIRCVAVKDGGSVTLWTRTRKPITSCPHIVEAIQKSFVGISVTLDGELYNHEYKSEFEKIVSAVRKDEPTEESAKVQYHIYDCVSDGPFMVRSGMISRFLGEGSEVLKVVPTEYVESEDHVPKFFEEYVSQGYEGLMLRNLRSSYENKRSYHLQKVKEFDDAEFEIVGVEEGRGKLQGLVGAIVCKTSSGETFKAKPMGDQEATRKYIENPDLIIGKMLTVKFQGYTGKNKVPRFPAGVAIRDYE